MTPRLTDRGFLLGAPNKIGPLEDNHPLTRYPERFRCPGCDKPFLAGQFVTLIVIGPGDNPESQCAHREGRYYNAVSIPAHWMCVTGESA